MFLHSPSLSTWPMAMLFATSLVHSTLASLPLVSVFSITSTPSSFDPSASSLLSRTTQGTLANLGNTNSGGSISSGCPLGDVFYIAGSFSSIGNVSANYVASYSPSSGTFSSVGSNGPNGPVTAVYCDVPNNNLWVGGHFSSPGSSVAVWNTKSNSWSAPPFKGLSGENAQVLSITSNTSSSSLFFAGSFVTSFAGNTTSVNNTNNPNVPYSPGASPFSSSLVPIPLQNAEIEAAPSSTNPEYSNIQTILCPAGSDGPGNTWLAQDGSSALISILTFSSISAYGVRLGNTFIDGYGTTGFSVTSIPDNTVQTLSYVDISTGQNNTCTDLCPLSTDSSVLYQDFLFSSPVTLTGVQITLSEWTGAAPGLHMMQLLSSGAFVSAIADGNTQSCFAPNPSNVTSTGTWTTKDASTDIPATLQTVLVSTVAVGTPAAQAPSFTWMPYVSAAGQYDINMIIPGCADFQDCDLRTSVQVTVFPGGGTQPYVSTVSQQNQDDTTVLLYSGPVVPSSSTFELTVTMALADSPVGSGQNDEYELVAGNLELTLTSANLTSSSGSTSSGTNSSASTGVLHGFGFFEWPLDSSTSFDATGTVPASGETFLDGVGVELYNALGASVSGSVEVSAVIQHSSGVLFLGGNFESSAGFSNIVAFKNGSVVALTNNGLNGAVSSFALDGNDLYIGGSFSDTQAPSMQGKLRGIAVYHVDSNSWGALGAGLDGPVTSVALSNSSQLQVVGNFTEALSPGNIASSVGGLAVWDISSGSWINSGGFVLGNMTFVSPSTSVGGKTEFQFVAGNIQSMAEYGSTGFVMLSNGADGPVITPISVQLDANTNASTVSTVNRRREHRARGPVSWFSQHMKAALIHRQQSSSLTLPPSPPTPAPAVLAGAFWSNASSSKEVAIIGGNFTFVSASGSVSQAVAIYDPSSSTINALPGSQVYGVVRALLVDSEQHLYVGGEFNLSSANGFAIYDLASGTPIVRSISNSAYKPNAVIVAGSFNQVGSVTCQAICLLDTQLSQWSVLGGGIQGDISSVSYAGSNEEFLVAGGAITLPNGTTTSVAQYSFSNATWTAVGNPTDIPGPVTALEVNDGNSSSIFAAGRTTDGSSSFMVFWDGISWSDIGTTLQGNSNISQLLMVPLQNTHSPNSVVESDRMLLVSGSLSDNSFGSASSVLFDGETFIPYISSLSAQGTMGFVSALFYSIANFSFVQQHFLATGIVILISIAIAAGVVFFLALYDSSDEDKDSIQHRPSSLLEHINAATRTTILGTGAFNVSTEKEEMAREGGSAEPDPFGPDGSNYLRAETPSDAVVGTMAAAEEYSRPAHARYAFDGTEEGELPLTVGLEVEVLDDRDAA
ncbi:cortical protein marker for cell polarity-domain-containing protein [Pisolithus sp. B1]|nr:cortical protein marker for cell polarity-domain-containing protein [Pisolithus sp. B1]